MPFFSPASLSAKGPKSAGGLSGTLSNQRVTRGRFKRLDCGIAYPEGNDRGQDAVVPTLRSRLDSSSSLNLLEQTLRGLPGNSILLGTERVEIYAVAARCIGGTTDVIVVLRPVLGDRVVSVLGEVCADQPGQIHPSPAAGQIPLIMVLDETKHGVRVPTLGSHGEPVLRISHAPQSLGNLGNGRWICTNIVTRPLEE